MSNKDLIKKFEEDSPQQVNEIENVRSLSDYVIRLQALEDEVKIIEENLKQKKEAADKISEEVIPEIMNDMKLKTRSLFPLVVAKITRRMITLALLRIMGTNLHKK
jgi:uncharacterized protein YwgA